MTEELIMDKPNNSSQDAETEKLKNQLKHIVDLISTSNKFSEEIKNREASLEARFSKYARHVDEQLQQIQSHLDNYQSLINEAGAKEFRESAENVLKVGEEHIEKIQEVTDDFRELAADAIGRLEQSITESERKINRVAKAFPLEQIKRLTAEAQEVVDDYTYSAIHRITKALRKFRWQKIAYSAAAAILASLITGFYFTGKLPWENRMIANQERMLGQAIISSWTNLSDQEKEFIEHKLNLAPAKHQNETTSTQ